VEEAFGLNYPAGELWAGSSTEKCKAYEMALAIYQRIIETIFQGMPLAHYEKMIEIYREHYPFS